LNKYLKFKFLFLAMEKKKERVAIFIDGSNFYHSTKNIEAKGYKIDLKKKLMS